MKRQRIIFLKKQKGQSMMGVTSLQFVKEGSLISIDKGGGRVASMIYKDGMVEIRKVTLDGKPCRNWGVVKMGETNGVQKDVKLEADCVIFPAHLCEAMLAVDEDDEEQTARPVQGQQRR